MSIGRGAVLVAGSVAFLCSCDGLLDVSDPNSITGDELDRNLPQVANGVEGAVHEVIDSWVLAQALLADVYQSTGNLDGIREIDQGEGEAVIQGMSGVGNAV